MIVLNSRSICFEEVSIRQLLLFTLFVYSSVRECVLHYFCDVNVRSVVSVGSDFDVIVGIDVTVGLEVSARERLEEVCEVHRKLLVRFAGRRVVGARNIASVVLVGVRSSLNGCRLDKVCYAVGNVIIRVA